jgi:glycosyltransferase involved in cell wall biosynthesis
MARLALRKNDTPRIFQVPGPLHLESSLFRKLDIKTAKENDYWIGTCNKTVQIYESCCVAKNKLFLGYYGGYGGEQCDRYSKNCEVLHKEYNVDSDRVLVGLVSYTYKPKWYAKQKRGIKGHEDFIDALAIVRGTYPQVLGVVIGGPWGNSQKYYQKVIKYAKRHLGNNIIFTGTRDDVKNVYCELDVVVHPSHSENLGGAAESLAAARPTISTNVGGFVDIVKDGETGYTVPAKNPEQLAKAIIKMLEDTTRANEMASKGQELVRKLLDINNTSKKILDIYKEILKQ